jgi:hypothetical protein
VSLMTHSGSIVRCADPGLCRPPSPGGEDRARVRDTGLGDALAGLPELHVEPLGPRDARALLESVLPAPRDERVLERVVAETRGNPLALLELPRGLSPTQLAGGFGLPQAVPVSAGIEESFMRRLATLSQEARRLLLVAAAAPVGDPALVWRAAERLGSPESAANTVEYRLERVASRHVTIFDQRPPSVPGRLHRTCWESR